jgi:glycosyltransferase involved in cell wall biosynthesis
MADQKVRVSVIVPCYNEESVIKESYSRLSRAMKETGHDYELVFINDGSKDQTPQLLNDLGKQDPNVVVIHFSRNFGHQPAVTAGLNNCTGNYAVIIDADLQDPPELIPEMLNMALTDGYNIVYAVRKQRKGETFFKKITAKFYYRLLNFMSETELPVDTGDFRLIDKKVIDTFNGLTEKHKYIRGLMSWVGFKQAPIYYDRDPRFAGETHYPFLKMLTFATRGLLYFTKKPLKLATQLGFLCIVVGLGLAVYVMASRYLHPEHIASGWSSVLITIVFFGGVQLLTVGVLGAYLGNIFDEVKSRPEYIIDTIEKKPVTLGSAT